MGKPDIRTSNPSASKAQKNTPAPTAVSNPNKTEPSFGKLWSTAETGVNVCGSVIPGKMLIR